MTRPALTRGDSLLRFCHRAVQTARLCCGVPDYSAYVQHLRAHHPDRAIPSYAEFFRERQDARYKGGSGRCC